MGVAAAAPGREGLPRVTDRRARSGDDANDPKWDERLTITVGPKKADLVGSNEKVLQAAVDYISRFGGGTVKVLPGTYTLRNSVYLRSGIRILGSGTDSVLLKGPSCKVALSDEASCIDVDRGERFALVDDQRPTTLQPDLALEIGIDLTFEVHAFKNR